MLLQGPHEEHKRRREVIRSQTAPPLHRPALPSERRLENKEGAREMERAPRSLRHTLLAWTAVSLAAGCGAFREAEVALVRGGAVVKSRTVGSEGADGSALRLVAAALDYARAAGEARPSIEGMGRFSAAAGEYLTVRFRASPEREERWRLDRSWAVLELETGASRAAGGVVFAWRGDMSAATATLLAVLR
jgi:hypothetical protein